MLLEISGLDTLLDALTAHFIIAVITTILTIIITFVVYQKTKRTTNEVVPEVQDKLGEYSLAERHSRQSSNADGFIKNIEENNEEVESISEEGNPLIDDASKWKNGFKHSSARTAEMVIEASMTEEQKQKERDVQREQLSQIFKLMQEQSDKFGLTSMEEVEQQMQLYQK